MKLINKLIILILFVHSITANAQTTEIKTYNWYFSVLQLGYVTPISHEQSGGQFMQTCAEYRFNPNQKTFIRLNIDSYESKYKLEKIESEKVLKGNTHIWDYLIGGGYRFGNEHVKFSSLCQLGISSYSVPKIEINDNEVQIREHQKSMGITRISLGIEYYLDPRFAVVLESFYNQYWQKKDFWRENTGCIGISIGIIASI